MLPATHLGAIFRNAEAIKAWFRSASATTVKRAECKARMLAALRMKVLIP
jgi:hypothetical protein